MFRNVYKNKKVFITGHTGFKGAWLTMWLLSMGAEVCGYSDGISTSPSVFNELGIAGRITHHQGDVRDLAELTLAIHDDLHASYGRFDTVSLCVFRAWAPPVGRRRHTSRHRAWQG